MYLLHAEMKHLKPCPYFKPEFWVEECDVLAWSLKPFDTCFSGIFAHASFRLRNMKNKLENKIEGAGLKRSPMGILLEALGQQEESFQKIHSFLEGKLKEWLDLNKCWHMLFTHVAQRIWNFLDVSGFFEFSFKLRTSSVECAQLQRNSFHSVGLQVYLRVSATPPRTCRGAFLSQPQWMFALCYADRPCCCTHGSFSLT